MKKTERFGMRLNAEDKKEWEKIAFSQGMSLSAWIEKIVNQEITRTKRLS